MKKKVEKIKEKVEVLKGPPRRFDHHRLKITKVPKKEGKIRVRRIRYYKGD